MRELIRADEDLALLEYHSHHYSPPPNVLPPKVFPYKTPALVLDGSVEREIAHQVGMADAFCHLVNRSGNEGRHQRPGYRRDQRENTDTPRPASLNGAGASNC